MPNNLNSKNVVLLGAGPMAMDYAKVLKHLGVNFTVVGKSLKGTQEFQKQMGIPAISKGLIGWQKEKRCKADYAIVAVSCEALANTAIELMDMGIRKILIEKPAGLTAKQIKKVCVNSQKTESKVFVAYNRRFYASVKEAQKLIEKDGGIQSFNFEFTEWCDQVAKKLKESTTGENWFLANSSHVIDLAFFLGGKPKEFHSYTAGGNDWHPTATVFSGAGITHSGALFSYRANWDAPGRWGVEVLTRKRKYIFCPLEKLQALKHNTVFVEPVKIKDRPDIEFKPGLYEQTKCFLQESSNTTLLNIHKHYENVTTFYEKIIHP
ncbi:MAG TPA: gfo/Idh/MocA family oxidoreductase [Nitrospinaceae bacterium]|nr:gfo/Idh/MocA family oxidoreductase [Nitrospinaceae bacterium]